MTGCLLQWDVYVSGSLHVTAAPGDGGEARLHCTIRDSELHRDLGRVGQFLPHDAFTRRLHSTSSTERRSDGRTRAPAAMCACMSRCSLLTVTDPPTDTVMQLSRYALAQHVYVDPERGSLTVLLSIYFFFILNI